MTRTLGFAVLLALVSISARAVAADPTPAPAEKPLDVREPPWGFGDFSWLNGHNRQPTSLLAVGPVTPSVYVDAYYGYQFQHPVDHVIFASTAGARHNEISINMAAIGLDVTGLDGPFGRVILQYASNVETVNAQDASTSRGYFLTARAFQYLQQASVGWHFHALHGINLEVGILPSHIGMETLLTQENWNYTRPFLSDFTPYYLMAGRIEIYPTDRLFLQGWVANGWQTYGKWHEAMALGYLVNWRPNDRISLTTAGYGGTDDRTDASAVRIYTDTYAQFRYFKSDTGALRSGAFSVVADIGGETDTGALGMGAALATRLDWARGFGTTLRADTYWDKNQTFITRLPLGSPYTLPDQDKPFFALGLTATLDYSPSPWILFRAEYVHRAATTHYFSGSGGITGPNGVPATDPATFAPDLRKGDDRVIVAATLRL
ncbi:hypothetical protein BH09MYX1_BH09MYX1_15280 [soil metagenome]